MATLRVVRGVKLAGITADSAQLWAAPASEKLTELLTPYLEAGETLPDVMLLQKLVGRLLADRQAELRAHDQNNVEQVTETRLLRLRRDELAGELRGVLRSARFYFEQKNGRGEGARLGIGNGLSYMSPVNLARTAAFILTRLAVDKAGPGPQPGSLMPAEQLEEALRSKAAELDEVLGRLRPQNVRENLSRACKYKSTEATEKAVRRGSAFLAGLYKLAELDGLAERVRPAFRRRRRKLAAQKGKGTAGTGGTAGTPEPETTTTALAPLPLIAEVVPEAVREERGEKRGTVLGFAARLLQSPRSWLKVLPSLPKAPERSPESRRMSGAGS